ncbi:hypothetical protein ACNUDN_07215 [Mycobacterium sp. smrl_JER01]|uniref:hypothetical protein n=1 Tax=Mycobacterium sp. smrl_JER01 TaxID=3402633 RepID=UPI003AD10C67
MVKKLNPNELITQLASSTTITVIAMSAVTTNATDAHRGGQGRKHHTHAQNSCSTTNTATANRDAEFPAEGSRTTAEITASKPVPRPISTWTAVEIDRLLKYCTCAG